MPYDYPEEAELLARLMLSVAPQSPAAQRLIAWTVKHRLETGYKAGRFVQSVIDGGYYPLFNEDLGPETPGWEEAVGAAGEVLSGSWRDSPFEGREGARHYWKPGTYPPGAYWTRTENGYFACPGWIETAREVAREGGVRFYRVPMEEVTRRMVNRIDGILSDGTLFHFPEGDLFEVERQEVYRFGNTYQWNIFRPSELLQRHITVRGQRQFISWDQNTEGFTSLESDGAGWPTIQFPDGLLSINERSVNFDGKTYHWKEVTVSEPVSRQIVQGFRYKLLFLGE